MNVEKLLELFQENVLPFVVHLETKERTKLFKALEKGENENELVLVWKQVLTEKGIDSDVVVKDYLTYANGLKQLNEEELKKLKNKNTYFLRKNTESLVKKFEELKLEVKEVLVFNDEVVKEEIIKEEVTSNLFFLKGKKKKKKKDNKKNKNKNRKKKDRKKNEK